MDAAGNVLQRSPPIRTGITLAFCGVARIHVLAAMEPAPVGRESRSRGQGGRGTRIGCNGARPFGRESRRRELRPAPGRQAAMEPAHSDGNHWAGPVRRGHGHGRCNGARPFGRESPCARAQCSRLRTRLQWSPPIRTGITRRATECPGWDTPCCNGARPFGRESPRLGSWSIRSSSCNGARPFGRESLGYTTAETEAARVLQWSPPIRTGITGPSNPHP